MCQAHRFYFSFLASGWLISGLIIASRYVFGFSILFGSRIFRDIKVTTSFETFGCESYTVFAGVLNA